MSLRVLGLGRDERGDDGVGLAVVRRLQAMGIPAVALPDPSALVECLDGTPTLLVDAVLAEPPGRLLELTLADLERTPAVSSHAMSVPDAIRLADVLNGPTPLRILGIAIHPPGPIQTGLSPAVAAAVGVAVERVHQLLESSSDA